MKQFSYCIEQNDISKGSPYPVIECELATDKDYKFKKFIIKYE